MRAEIKLRSDFRTGVIGCRAWHPVILPNPFQCRLGKIFIVKVGSKLEV